MGTQPCSDPSCRCQIPARSSDGWRIGFDGNSALHGIASYHKGCRCDECRQAAREAKRKWRKERRAREAQRSRQV